MTTRAGGDADADAFAEVFARHRDRAVRLAYLHCGDRDRAEEAVAEAMAKVFRRWRRGGIRDVGPYLRVAVVNEVRAGGRRRVRDRALVDRAGGELVTRAGGAPDGRGGPDAGDALGQRDELVAALQRLPERQRLAVVLRHVEGLSEAETAEAMGISVGGVKSQCSRGLDALRAVLTTGEVER
ncbi:MAG: sigma-70 family RNA polymerase sigma factor [Actinomycetes bacterium]